MRDGFDLDSPDGGRLSVEAMDQLFGGLPVVQAGDDFTPPLNMLGPPGRPVLPSLTTEAAQQRAKSARQALMGSNPSYFTSSGSEAPVEKVSWNDIRGRNDSWPGGEPDGDSFLGRLRQKTGKRFDLPTEAQWEYACRAGTSTGLYSGKELTSNTRCSNLDLLGWHGRVKGETDRTHSVGELAANAWRVHKNLSLSVIINLPPCSTA